MSNSRAGTRLISIRLGLAENWQQFTLLAIVNLFVGGMVGLERTVTPLVGAEQFHLNALTVSLFVVAFGVAKAITNLVGGAITGRYTRKAILVSGWLVGVPVPFMLAYGPSWGVVIAANLLLGVNQGLTWSMTVNMKIDLIGPARRGLALGINEAAGYLGVAVTALATGYIATAHGLRPAPELLGVGYVAAGLLLAIFAIRDTAAHADLEKQRHTQPERARPFREVAALVTYRDRTLAGATQAGLINNFNDGLVWVVLPVLLLQHGVGLGNIGLIKALYPFVWAIGMVGTGHLADVVGREKPIAAGMLLQAAGLAAIIVGLFHPLTAGLLGAFLLGGGTALVYPALLAAITDAAHPSWRPNALGVYRFWRDTGYALGALTGGLVAVLASLTTAIAVAAALTALSGMAAAALIRIPARDADGAPPAA